MCLSCSPDIPTEKVFPEGEEGQEGSEGHTPQQQTQQMPMMMGGPQPMMGGPMPGMRMLLQIY